MVIQQAMHESHEKQASFKPFSFYEKQLGHASAGNGPHCNPGVTRVVRRFLFARREPWNIFNNRQPCILWLSLSKNHKMLQCNFTLEENRNAFTSFRDAILKLLPTRPALDNDHSSRRGFTSEATLNVETHLKKQMYPWPLQETQSNPRKLEIIQKTKSWNSVARPQSCIVNKSTKKRSENGGGNVRRWNFSCTEWSDYAAMGACLIVSGTFLQTFVRCNCNARK